MSRDVFDRLNSAMESDCAVASAEKQLKRLRFAAAAKNEVRRDRGTLFALPDDSELARTSTIPICLRAGKFP
jgi:hypothetical protein